MRDEASFSGAFPVTADEPFYAGVGQPADSERARETRQGFGCFVRSLVGLDRAAVVEALGEFLSGGTATVAQIEFVKWSSST